MPRSTSLLATNLKIDRLSEIDWDFSESRSESAFSWIHWHPCRFPSQIPTSIIGTLTKPGDTVLDPFVGSGTTAIEAQKLGRKFVGIELNPVAAMMTCAKTLPISAETIQTEINRIKLGIRKVKSTRRLAPLESIPNVQLGKWYVESVQRDLRTLWKWIIQSAGTEQLLAKTAFSSILLPVCRETRQWGYVCDNTEPKGDYSRDTIDEFNRVLDLIAKAYKQRDAYIKGAQNGDLSIERCEIMEGNASVCLKSLEKKSVDLIVTSPPYFGVTDYTKSQRLSMEWFGWDIEPLRKKEIGARSKRHRLCALAEYLQEISEVVNLCRSVLRRGGTFAVVFGESSARESVKDNFIRSVEAEGFSLYRTMTRRISQRRRQNPSLLNESILFFR